MTKAKTLAGKTSTLGNIAKMFASRIRKSGAAKKPIEVQLAALLSVFIMSPLSAGEAQTGGEATVDTDATRAASWLEGDTLTGDWAGRRTTLKEDYGITLAPRLTQFYQGLSAGDGDHDFEYGGKADLLMNADLSKLGLWKGLSLTVHAEYNFGESNTGAGGTLIPPNTALLFPGMEGSDAFDLSSVYFMQHFSKSVTVLAGKINMMDLAATKPFMGGAGIDSFWNLTFAAPPTGLVPPYLFGALLSVRTEPANFGLWIYDPNSVINKSGFEDPFDNGVTIRGSVDFPVTIAGLSGHQGFVALYSTEANADLSDIGRNTLPPFPPNSPGIKDRNYYFAYSFDQYLYQPSKDSKEGVGLFGQFGISDGNPSRLYWSALVGIGGTGLIPGRDHDNWGIGYYYDAPSPDLKDSLPLLTIRDEQGMEIFYNFAVTPFFTVGVDLQVINPSLGSETAVLPGLRSVIRF
jgi:porin